MNEDAAAPELKLATLLERVSGSLDALADIVHGVEHTIGGELGNGKAMPMESITRLQQLDLIRQTLEDLSILSLALSKDRDGVVQPDVAEKLRLTATKELLKAAPAHAEATRGTPVDSGAVDLF